jgi:glycerol-3-phosphate O-acyltransferase
LVTIEDSTNHSVDGKSRQTADQGPAPSEKRSLLQRILRVPTLAEREARELAARTKKAQKQADSIVKELLDEIL